MKENVTQSDIRFWAFLAGILIPVIIWGISLQGKVSANEGSIAELNRNVHASSTSLSSIDRRLLKIEIKLGIDKISVEDLKSE